MDIRLSVEADFPAMLTIVNDAARAYSGVIPADRWHEPYMPADELESEIAGGVVFWVAEHTDRYLGGRIVGHRVLSAERIHGRSRQG